MKASRIFWTLIFVKLNPSVGKIDLLTRFEQFWFSRTSKKSEKLKIDIECFPFFKYQVARKNYQNYYFIHYISTGGGVYNPSIFSFYGLIGTPNSVVFALFYILRDTTFTYFRDYRHTSTRAYRQPLCNVAYFMQTCAKGREKILPQFLTFPIL